MDGEHRTRKRESLGAQLPPPRKEIKGVVKGGKNVGNLEGISSINSDQKRDESSREIDGNEGSDDVCDGKVEVNDDSADKNCDGKNNNGENN